jgi:hypothetical protein
LLASNSPQGLMTQVQNFGINDFNGKTYVINKLLSYKGTSEVSRAEQVICQFLDKDSSEYLSNKKYEINCSR